MSEKRITITIIIASIIVPVLVSVLFFLQPIQIKTSFDLHIFPKFHAILNSSTAICLILGMYFIKNKNIKLHKASNLTAFALSTVFLVSYVTYHSVAPTTKYGGDGILRYIYYFILLTHIVLAAGILPLILFTFQRALSGQIEKHKKLAKFTFPLWLYIAVTGVLVYILIKPYYI